MPEYLAPRPRRTPAVARSWSRRCGGTTRPSAAAPPSPTSRGPRPRPSHASWRRHAGLRRHAELAAVRRRRAARRRARTASATWSPIPMAPQYSTLSVGEVPRGRGGASAGLDRAFRRVAGTTIPACSTRSRSGSGRPRPRTRGRRPLHRAQPARARHRGRGSLRRPGAAHRARRWPSAAGLAALRRAFQSAGRTPEPWLGPSLEEALRAAQARGARRVLVASRSGSSATTRRSSSTSTCRRRGDARALGLAFGRTESLNTCPTLIRALADLVRRALLSVTPRAWGAARRARGLDRGGGEDAAPPREREGPRPLAVDEPGPERAQHGLDEAAAATP